MESNNKKIIIAAIILAFFTAFLIYIYLGKRNVTPVVKVSYAEVYVAGKTLPAKYKITDGDLKKVKITNEYINPNAVLKKDEIIGKRLKDRIIEGEQILKDRLVDPRNADLEYNIPAGKRAVSININEQISVGYNLKPGDYVDVIASFDKEEIDMGTEKRINPKVSKMIIQNAELLALGQVQSANGDMPKDLFKSATLALTPQEAEKIVFASDYGVVRLLLRGAEDDNTTETSGIIRSDLIPEKGAVITKK